MKKFILFFILLLPVLTFGQSVDGAVKTLTTTGTSTAYVVSEALPTAYDPKERFIIRFHTDCGDDPTINRAGLGAKNLKFAGNTAIASGDLKAKGTYLCSYNATDGYYQVHGTAGGGGGSSTFVGLTDGPGAFTGKTLNFIRVNSGETALEYQTPSQVRTGLSLVIGTNIQAWDTDLDAIAALSASNDDVLQRKAGAWTNRTIAQLKTDLNITSITGNAGTATALQTGRTIGITGDLTWTSPSFDGTGNVTAAGTLASTAVTPGSYTNASITVDAKGRVTAASTGASSGAPALVPTAVKTSNYSAAVTDFVPVDPSGGSFNVTLPTAPADKSQIAVKIVTSPGANSVGIVCGGSDVFNISGGSTTLTLNQKFQSKVLQYKASGAIWYVISDDNPVPMADNVAHIFNITDNTKKIIFSAASVSTSTTRTWTFPDVNGTVARNDAAQTFAGVQTFSAAPVFSTAFTLPNSTIATTQSVGDNSTKVATSALVASEVTSGVYTASGTNTYTVTIPGVTAYANSKVTVLFTNANSNTSTVNVNSLGAITVKKAVSSNVITGDIAAGSIHTLTYDGTNYQISDVAPSTSGWATTGTTTLGTGGSVPTIVGDPIFNGVPNVVFNLDASHIYQQKWEDGSANPTMTFGAISTSDLSPALKICASSRSLSPELALTQTVTTPRDYGGYFLVAATTSNMSWYTRLNNSDTEIFRVTTSDLSFTVLAGNLNSQGQTNTQTKATNGSVSTAIVNTNSSSSSSASYSAQSSATTGWFRVYSAGFGGYKTFAASTLAIWNQTAGGIAILTDAAAGTVSLTAGGASTAGYLLGAANQNTWTTAAQTGLGATVETIGYTYNGATYTSASGTTAINRGHYFKAFTYAGTSGTHITTDSYGSYFESNAAGTNGAITNSYGVGVDGNIALVTLGNKLFIKEGSGGSVGQTTLVSGTKAVTISGVTTSTRCFAQRVTASGTTLTVNYDCACTANTLTITADVAAGTINTADGSTLNYFIIEPKP